MTHYNEPFSVMQPGISLLLNQKGFLPDDIRLTIVHDGTEILPELNELDFPFEFRQFSIPHRGVSGARNFGIEQADAEWITFCDCDDGYTGIYALKRILQGLEEGDFNILWSQFYVERTKEEDPDGKWLGLHKDLNFVWIHNKYFRLDFLRRHKILFNEDLDISEDGAFCVEAMLQCREGEIGEISVPEALYVWRRREGSTTTSKENVVKINRGVLKRDIYVAGLWQKSRSVSAPLAAGRAITDAYARLTQKRMEAYPEETREIEAMMLIFWQQNEWQLKQLSEDQWAYVLKAAETELQVNGTLNADRPAFDSWLKERLGVERQSLNSQYVPLKTMKGSSVS